MEEDVLEEMMGNRFLVFLINEGAYPGNLLDIVAAAGKQYRKICYVCLSNTYEDVLAWMNPAGLDLNKFYFIDTLSRYYGERVSDEKCFFVSSPSSLDEIKYALSFALKERGCEMVIFDAISSLLEYKDMFSILQFTHTLMTENHYAGAKKLYIILGGNTLPEEESKRLVTDLEMFADKTIDFR